MGFALSQSVPLPPLQPEAHQIFRSPRPRGRFVANPRCLISKSQQTTAHLFGQSGVYLHGWRAFVVFEVSRLRESYRTM